MARLPRVQEGDPITDALFNALIEAANRCRIEVGHGLRADDGPRGTILSAVLGLPFYAKITGPISGGTYPWTEQFPATGGGWTDGTRTGVAYERSGNASVPDDTVVEMKWSSVGDYRFAAGEC